MVKQKLVAIDVDGTLFDDAMNLSQKNIEAIQKAEAYGIRIILATGRMYRSAARIAARMGLKNPIIAYNGAMIRSASELIFHRTIPHCAALDVIAFARDKGLFNLIFVNDRVFSERRDHDLNQYYEHHSGVTVEMVERLEQAMEEGEPTKFLWLVEPVQAESIKQQFQEIPAASGINLTQSMADMLELMDQSVAKGMALEILARYLNIPRENLVAIGDNENDLEMFAQSPVSIAMGNASPLIKQSAKYVTVTNNEDGVAYALEHYILNGDGD